jgi:hypothetical protein
LALAQTRKSFGQDSRNLHGEDMWVLLGLASSGERSPVELHLANQGHVCMSPPTSVAKELLGIRDVREKPNRRPVPRNDPMGQLLRVPGGSPPGGPGISILREDLETIFAEIPPDQTHPVLLQKVLDPGLSPSGEIPGSLLHEEVPMPQLERDPFLA